MEKEVKKSSNLVKEVKPPTLDNKEKTVKSRKILMKYNFLSNKITISVTI